MLYTEFQNRDKKMKQYKIQDKKYIEPYEYELSLTHGKKEHCDIVIKRNRATDKLRPARRVTILRDKFLSIEDYVYLYRGGMEMHTMPANLDKYSCKLYIENLPGLFDYGRLDRAIFKIALWRECERRSITPSFNAWHNLQNIMIDRTKNHPRW